MLGVILYLTPC